MCDITASGLSAIHLELTYDPAVVTADTVTRGTLAGSNVLVDFNVVEPGHLLIGMTREGILVGHHGDDLERIHGAAYSPPGVLHEDSALFLDADGRGLTVLRVLQGWVERYKVAL